MKYTLYLNFLPVTSFEGDPSSDKHGQYIIFPADAFGHVTAGSFLKDESGAFFQIIEESP